MYHRNVPGLYAVLTRSNLCPMSQRPLSRSLLSLLMIWQLLLSVLAHPLSAAAPQAGMQESAAVQLSADCCPHELMPMTSHHAMGEHHADNAETTSKSHACDVACDCHCAGVSALVFVAPDLPTMQPRSQTTWTQVSTRLSSPLTSPLRPPIY